MRSLLGRDTSSFFFDEIRGAEALGAPALLFALLTLGIGVVAATYFMAVTHRRIGWRAVMVVIVGAGIGAYLWSIVGAALFPGGHGFG